MNSEEKGEIIFDRDDPKNPIKIIPEEDTLKRVTSRELFPKEPDMLEQSEKRKLTPEEIAKADQEASEKKNTVVERITRITTLTGRNIVNNPDLWFLTTFIIFLICCGYYYARINLKLQPNEIKSYFTEYLNLILFAFGAISSLLIKISMGEGVLSQAIREKLLGISQAIIEKLLGIFKKKDDLDEWGRTIKPKD